MNRRGFFRAMRTALVGGAAAVVGLSALPAKPKAKLYPFQEKALRKWNSCPSLLMYYNRRDVELTEKMYKISATSPGTIRWVGVDKSGK